MKICWDNLHKLRFSQRTGAWYTATSTKYVEMDSCKVCGEPFLTVSEKGGRFSNEYCSRSCFSQDGNAISKRSEKVKEATKSSIVKEKISNSLRKTLLKSPRTPEKCSKWKGGLTDLGFASFDHYRKILEGIDEVRFAPSNPNILQVKCAQCKKWFTPTLNQASERARYILGKKNTESRFYCSDSCKNLCPIFGQVKYPKGHIVTNREVQPQLRKMVFERDDFQCQRCGSKKDLHCHHIDPVISNPIESADMDNCITFCLQCHELAHSSRECSKPALARCL